MEALPYDNYGNLKGGGSDMFLFAYVEELFQHENIRLAPWMSGTGKVASIIPQEYLLPPLVATYKFLTHAF